MKIESLAEGQVVYDVHSHRMGNTTMRTMGCWTVKIIAVNKIDGWVIASWNNNPSQKFYGRKFTWRKEKPLMISTGLGKRLATREEIAANKAALAALTPEQES